MSDPTNADTITRKLDELGITVVNTIDPVDGAKVPTIDLTQAGVLVTALEQAGKELAEAKADAWDEGQGVGFGFAISVSGQQEMNPYRATPTTDAVKLDPEPENEKRWENPLFICPRPAAKLPEKGEN